MFEHTRLIPHAVLPVILTVSFASPAWSMTGQEVNNAAREFTVLIAKNPTNNGSGVIIAKDGNDYYVLTARHVVGVLQDRDGPIQYTIVTHDKKSHAVESSDIAYFPGADLALVKFESNSNYQVAELADSDLVTEGTPVFVSGWPMPATISEQSGQAHIRQFTDGRVSTVLEENYEGYQLGYSNTTSVGMSGGPVVDAAARVVAIHGLADSFNVSEFISLQSPASSGADQKQALQAMSNLGFNFGVPINTFLSMLPELENTEHSEFAEIELTTSNFAPPELGAPYEPSSEPDSRDVITDMDDVLGSANRGLNLICGITSIFGGGCR
jgi:S1-C subfamily serine protease